MPLQFVKEQSGSGSTVQLTDCFSSKYKTYKLDITALDMQNQVSLSMRFLNSSNAEITATNYDLARQTLYSHADFGQTRKTGQNRFEIDYYDTDATAYGIGVSMYIYNPFDSLYTYFVEQGSYYEQIAPGGDGTKQIGCLKETTSATGLSFFQTTSGSLSGSIEAIAFQVYGVK